MKKVSVTVQGLSVRQFRDGDEPAIVELFNRVYGEFGGFVPRTVEYWRWCCLERPDVERDGVLLAFAGEKFCGYVVAGTSGNIWELCVADCENEATRILLSKALSYLEKMGASSVSVNMPTLAGITETLREAGFSEIHGPLMFVTTLNPAALTQALVNPRKGVLMKRLDEIFEVELHEAPYGACNELSVKIDKACVEVTEGLATRPSVIVELRFIDYLSIIFEGSNAVRLFLTGKMKIKPFWKASAVMTLLSIIRVRDSWFFPLSDSV